jgi:hypothetical protein
MKIIIIRTLLLVSVFLLIFMSYRSVMGDIEFDREAGIRDRAVIDRLVDIRTAQVALRSRTGTFTADFDTLIAFVRDGYMVRVASVGHLTEEQLEGGMTVARAMEIINTGNRRDIERAGLWDAENDSPQLRRDSLFDPAREVLFPNRPHFNPDDMAYVPFGDGAKFEMGVDYITTAAGPLQVFEARTPFTTYLSDLDYRLLQQRIRERYERPGLETSPRRFAGMQVGSLHEVVNNAGNWE